MSKQVYERLLAEFREAWRTHDDELFNVNIFAPSGEIVGFGPPLDQPAYDREKYDLIAEVALPLDASREVTSDGRNSTLLGYAVSAKEYRSAEALTTFKRLCGEAGAALSPEFRDRLAGLCPWEMRRPETWWLALLVTLHGDSACLPDGRYLGEAVWVRPFLLCVEAIERCRLNTDNPGFPERNTGVSATGDDEDVQAVCGDGTAHPKPKTPSKKAWLAYYIREVGIMNQTEIAQTMVKRGTAAEQGSVSRWLRDVDAFLKAGGMAPPVQELHAQPQSIDPSILDMGPRQDHLTPRQRPKRDPDSEDEDRD